MTAEEQIQCDFCTFSSIPFCNGPVILLYECYMDASCHLRFLHVFLDSVAIFLCTRGNCFTVQGWFFSIVCNTLSLTICNAHRERLCLNGEEINPRVVTKTTMERAEPSQIKVQPQLFAKTTGIGYIFNLQTRRIIPVGSGKSKQYLILKSCP